MLMPATLKIYLERYLLLLEGFLILKCPKVRTDLDKVPLSGRIHGELSIMVIPKAANPEQTNEF